MKIYHLPITYNSAALGHLVCWMMFYGHFKYLQFVYRLFKNPLFCVGRFQMFYKNFAEKFVKSVHKVKKKCMNTEKHCYFYPFVLKKSSFVQHNIFCAGTQFCVYTVMCLHTLRGRSEMIFK